MSRVLQQSSRFAAITGAGSGLGRDIVLGLAAKGYRVFGTAITPEEITDLQQASGGPQRSVFRLKCSETEPRWRHTLLPPSEAGRPFIMVETRGTDRHN
jgi:NAD(P)-dependent dehydrogenase (short-subunit alcohol dehydrogenase family)